MSDIQARDSSQVVQERRARIIVMGAGLGALLGLISGYLYTKAAEENGEGEAEPGASISTGQLLAVLLAMLGLVRQIAELGKPSDDKKRGKK